NPVQLLVGTNVVWTYLLTNSGTLSVTVNSLTDDAGTPGNPVDDFPPKYVSGDSNNNSLLDPNETWLYTSSGKVSYQVHAGLYGNLATATGTGSDGTPVTVADPNHHV